MIYGWNFIVLLKRGLCGNIWCVICLLLLIVVWMYVLRIKCGGSFLVRWCILVILKLVSWGFILYGSCLKGLLKLEFINKFLLIGVCLFLIYFINCGFKLFIRFLIFDFCIMFVW